MELTFFLANGFLDNPPDFLKFLGRFHPLVVHLPIGFLLLAVIAQLATRKIKFHPLRPFLKYLWGLGAISAALAVLFGYLLSLLGDYDANTLFWHKWSGGAVLIFSAACYFISKRRPDTSDISKWALIILATGTMIYTGHLGGNLTHGQTYLLEYAPNPVRSMAGLPPKTEPRPKVTVLDSAEVYLDLISLMMHSKCTSCHNDGKKKGDLVLTSYSNMLRGGENGEVIIPGDIEASELFRRITLPEEHDDFMPSEGKRPLTEQEVAIIEWWIASGAPSEGRVTELDSEKKIIPVVNNYLGLDKNDIFNKEIPPPDISIIDSLRNQGFIINRLMKDNYFLDANFSLSERELIDSDLILLQNLKEQLIWLDLSNSGVKDEHLEKIGQLENLVKLDLNGNDISDNGIQQLEKLTNLESLNLYQTNVSDGLLRVIPKLTRLQRVYLWKTKINDSIALRLQEENKSLKINYNREEPIDQ
ncbi:c-type cytochrome domain-containing protein [Maribacter halichondriae]|uniref:c-type cytochrome domain-containing protein n=1 Tax=Maribacter halichondriae TaxID=2980554 RepID=UPI002358890D|nr:c-type cytochrome domain-containing protein [Maribacter sp. Hal144]